MYALSKKKFYMIVILAALQPLTVLGLLHAVNNQMESTLELVVVSLNTRNINNTQKFLDLEPQHVVAVTGFNTRDAYETSVKDMDLHYEQAKTKAISNATRGSYILGGLLLLMLISNFLLMRELFKLKPKG